jgi:photosystem II stability/assembly factor-like uncharacterized protein
MRRHVLAPVLLALAGSTLLAQTAGQGSAPSIWQLQESGTTAGLRGIDSVEGTVAWASGTGGTVLRTIDGGAHWQHCAIPDAGKDGATLDFRGVQAWDANTAIVMASGSGDKSRLYKTTDGCKSWKLLFKNPDSPDGFFDSFWINPAYHKGILLGDPVKNNFAVFETLDAGITWQRDDSGGLEIGSKPIAGFAASNSLIPQFGAGYMHGFVTGGQGGSFLIHKWDGKHWSRSSIPLNNGTDASGAFSVAYRVTLPPCTDCAGPFYQFAIAVGGDYTKPNDSVGTAAYSLDGGQHWTASTTPPHGYRSTVQWSQLLHAWFTAGTNGSDISHDDGKTWQPLDNGNWNALSLPFIVGPNGRIAKLNSTALPKPQ